MRITVTQEDIQNGKPRDCHNCMIALAVRRAVAGTDIDAVSVETSGRNWLVRYHRPAPLGVSNYHSFPLPDAVGKRAAAFDHGLEVEPFEFEFCPVEGT